ncbi:MAG: DUF4369 domain-containing protein [Bacteroidales bacterium]|nr:DUF4369 domain-containing protein [Bacteroidales bacterium]
MKKTHLIPLLALIITLAACTGKNGIVIEGTLENGAGKVIYIEEMTPDSRLFIDSITLDSKGRFRFKYDMPYKTFYNLHVSENDYVVLLPDFGETIEVSGNYNGLSQSYSLRGGHDSQLLWQLQDYSNQGAEVLSDIVATDSKNRQLLADGDMSQQEYDHEREVTDSIYLATFAEQQQYVVHFIEDNLGNLSTLIALYKPFNNRPLINPADSFEFYEAVLEGLQETMPDNPHTLHFKNMVERTRFQYVQ